MKTFIIFIIGNYIIDLDCDNRLNPNPYYGY